MQNIPLGLFSLIKNRQIIYTFFITHYNVPKGHCTYPNINLMELN